MSTSTNQNQGTAPYWRRNATTFLFWGALGLILVGSFSGWFEETNPLIGKTAPAFKLATMDGTPVDLKDHLGKDVILLDFFATWCPPCRESLPHIAQLAKDYAEKGVVVFAVNGGEDKPTVAAYFREQKLELNALLDEQGEASTAYGVSVIPQQVIIGRDGRVQFVNVGNGFGLVSSLRGALDALLAGQSLASQPPPAAQ